MRKTLLALITGVLCVLLLTGCGQDPVEAAQKAIDDIGVVSLDSLGDIEAAEKLYEVLSQEDKEQITNYDALTAARKAYQDLVLLDQAAAAIWEAAEVTYIRDGYSYETPREDFDCTDEELPDVLAYWSTDGRTAELSADGQYVIFTEPPTYLVYLEDYHLYQTMYPLLRELRAAGLIDKLPEQEQDYLKGIETAAANLYYGYAGPWEGTLQEKLEFLLEVMETFPEHESLEDLQATCFFVYYDMAEEQEALDNYEAARELYSLSIAYDSRDYGYGEEGVLNCDLVLMKREREAMDLSDIETVYTQLTEMANKLRAMEVQYGDLWSWRAEDFLEDVEAQLVQLETDFRPENNEILRNDFTSCYAPFSMTAGDSDACFKIYADDGTCVMVYVHANNKASIKLPNGTFRVEVATGLFWQGADTLFGKNTTCYRVKNFEVMFTGGNADIVGITFYQHNGNTAFSMLEDGELNSMLVEISKDEF